MQNEIELKKQKAAILREKLENKRKASLERMENQRKSLIENIKEEQFLQKQNANIMNESKSIEIRQKIAFLKESHRQKANSRTMSKPEKVHKIYQKKIAKQAKLRKLDAYRLKLLGDIEIEFIKRLKDTQARQEKELAKLKNTVDNPKNSLYVEYKQKVKNLRLKSGSVHMKNNGFSHMSPKNEKSDDKLKNYNSNN